MTVCLPIWGEVWQYGCPQSPMWDSESDCSENVHDNAFEEGSVISSTFSSEESFEYHKHNIWNPMLASLCHLEVGVVLEALFLTK